MEQYFGYAAGVVSIIGYIPYLRDILRRTTRPDRASWIIWAVEYTVLFIAQMAEGATHSLWLIGMQTLCVVVVCALSLRFGVGGLTWQNLLALSGAGAGLVLWLFTNDPALAIVIALAVEATGVLLTAVKTFKDPSSETLSMWVCAGTAGILGIFAVGSTQNHVLYAYPVALALMCFAIAAIIILVKRATIPALETSES